jgi:ABC transporter DrrB family efflux protein
VGSGLGAVVYKEIHQIRRDPVSLFLSLAIPVLQLVIFGVAIDTEVRDVPLAVVDLARVRESREFAAALEATRVFRVERRGLSRAEALSWLRAGEVKASLLLPEDFSERLLSGETAAAQLLLDGSDSNVAMQAQAAAFGVASEFSRRRRGTDSAGAVVEVRPRLLYNPDGRSEAFFVPGLAGIILQLVTMTLTAFSIVRERERGTLEQLLVTPVSRFGLTLGKILPPILLGAAATLLALLVMVFLFDVRIAGALSLLAPLTLLFLFTSLALGLLVSVVATTQLQALMLTILLLMPSVLLSGFMFPRAGMPSPIYELTFALPATYYIEILRGVVLRGARAADLLPNILPLAAIGLLLTLFSSLRLRRPPS